MGCFVGKQVDGYEMWIGCLLLGYELLYLFSCVQLLVCLLEWVCLFSVGCGVGGELVELVGLCLGWCFVVVDLLVDMFVLVCQCCVRFGLLEWIELYCGDVVGLLFVLFCDVVLVLLVLYFLCGDQVKWCFFEVVVECLVLVVLLLLVNLMEVWDVFECLVQVEVCCLVGFFLEDSDGML